MANFSIENGVVRTNVYKKQDGWNYFRTPYGVILRMPFSDYVTTNDVWKAIAVSQSDEFDGFVFVVPKNTKFGYRPLDFEGTDYEAYQYIKNKNIYCND